MKQKIKILVACLLILTSYTAKSQTIISGYNDNDVQKLQAFFTQTDSTGTTNGVKINTTYSSTDPTTWTGVTWDSSNPKNVTEIYLYSTNQDLIGFLNCSNFGSLNKLDISMNKIDSLYLYNLPNLTYLNCGENLIKTLNVNTLTSLTDLYCYENKLKTLNVDKLINLKYLGCGFNKIDILEVDKLLSLKELYCTSNKIKTLNLKPLSGSLEKLHCDINQLTTLNVDSFPMLHELFDANNKLRFSTMQFPLVTFSTFLFPVLQRGPQPPFIPIGVDTTHNSMSITTGDTVDLSAEVYVSGRGPAKDSTTFSVWKKANDGTISRVTNLCSINNGKIILPNTLENDSVFIAMENPVCQDFPINTGIYAFSLSMRTVTFKIIAPSAVLPTENNNKTAIKIYPNPANNEISVIGNEEDLNSIKIYNSLGQDVTKYTNYSSSNTKQITIDISKLTTGIYILKTKNTTNKLIVK